MKFAVCFCVHAGDLEIKAMLLAASLRKHWPATVELIACVPTAPEFGGVSQTCAEVLGTLGVRLQNVENPIGPNRPVANKLLCLEVATGADRIIFLDCDILALCPAAECELDNVFGEDFVAKPADKNSSRLEADGWRKLYAECGVSPWQATVRATVTGENMAPYFNSGVLAAKTNSGIGRWWPFYYAEVSRLRPDLAQLYVFDQIPLSIALAKLGHTIRLLDEAWNFPAHLKSMHDLIPKLCHYHYTRVILASPVLLELAAQLVSHLPRLASLMKQSNAWAPLARAVEARS
jgi:hypothetical protein